MYVLVEGCGIASHVKDSVASSAVPTSSNLTGGLNERNSTNTKQNSIGR